MVNNVTLSGVITTKPEHKIAYGEISTRFTISVVGATGLTTVMSAEKYLTAYAKTVR